MKNYSEFVSDCYQLADSISDRDATFVRSLILAAASIDVTSVVSDLCLLLDRFTGCGSSYISSEILRLHNKYF